MYSKYNVYILPADMSSTPASECSGLLFINNDNVISRLFDREDIVKSHSFFGAVPYHVYITSNEPIRKSDFYLESDLFYANYVSDAKAANSSKNNRGRVIASTNKVCGCLGIPDAFLDYYLEQYRLGNTITEVDAEVDRKIKIRLLGPWEERIHDAAIKAVGYSEDKFDNEDYDKVRFFEIGVTSNVAKDYWFGEFKKELNETS